MRLKTILVLLWCACCVQAQEKVMMLVGTYTYGGSKGIYSYYFNQKTGEAEALNSLALTNPSYLTISHDGRLVYAVSETNDERASLNTIRLNPKTGDMQLLHSAAVMGGDPCYVATNGKAVLTANYSGGSMSVLLLKRIGYQPTATHPRQFNITPNGQYLLCCCRDSDKIQVFRRDMQTGLLTDIHKDIPVSKVVCVQFVNEHKPSRL